jgi:EmrB/QacA subfamily drug resistance transporter
VVAVAFPRAGIRERVFALPYHWQAVIVIVLGSFMVFLNMTIVNVAMPRIIQVFQTTVDRGQLVIAAYMVALAVVAPASGYASDRFGAKRVYLTSIALFTVATTFCALAANIEMMIVFRIIQGLGGAMILPLGMTILFQVVPPQQRGSVMGVYGVPLLIAPMMGPVLGGYLVEFVDWRFVFIVGTPVGVLAVLCGMLILRETPIRAGGGFDWWGFWFASIGFSSALAALARAPADGWTAPHVLLLWLIAAFCIPAFILVELTQEHPLLDLRVLMNTTYAIATVLTGISTVAMFSSLFLLPLFLQNTRGLGAMDSGLLMLPQAGTAALMMPIAGRVLDKFGPRPLVVPGLVALAYATWLLSKMTLDTPDNDLRIALVLRGIAMGCMMMPVSTVAMETIPRQLISRATALTNVNRQLFGAFGTAVFASLLVERQELHQEILSQTVTATDIATLQTLSTVRQSLIAQGMALGSVDTAGLMLLARQVAQNAAVKAFDDCFVVATFIALVGIVPAIFLKRARRLT